MKQVLIIEDDKVITNMYQQLLKAAGFSVEVAADGKLGLEKLAAHRPDIVMLDFMMPVLNGLEVLKRIRADTQYRDLPVLVFSNSTASDTVNELRQAGATQVLIKANSTPKKVIEMIHNMSVPQENKNSAAPASADDEFQAELRKSCLEEGLAAMQSIQSVFQALAKNPSDAAVLQDLYRQIHSVAGNSGLAGLQTISRVSAALEALLKELGEKPDRVTPSVLRTAAQSIDLLARLFEHPLPAEKDQLPSANILALDDQDVALRAVSHSLEKANLKPTCVQDPVTALKIVAEKQFDLVISDIEMPGMTGLEVCSKLRTMPNYQKVPVVFVTTLSSFEHRAQACLSGGNDLIAKPFLFSELAVKALTLLLKSRVGQSES
jgi:CheY-like chemotaxis protein